MDSGDPNHKPTAICLVRVDVSGLESPRHATDARRHALRLGYVHLYTVRPPADYSDPIGYALGIAAGLGVAALIVYDLATVDNMPSRVCDVCDLETVIPPQTWAASLPGLVDPAHQHPDHPLTVAEAKRIMQQHLTCRAVECPRKSSAYSCLVRAGQIVPPVDTPRERAAARGGAVPSTPCRPTGFRPPGHPNTARCAGRSRQAGCRPASLDRPSRTRPPRIVGRRAGMDGIHCTNVGDLQAIWRLHKQRVMIMRVHTIPDGEAVVSFDPGPYPDLAEARERFAELTRLWDAVRHEYWAELAPPHRVPRGRSVT